MEYTKGNWKRGSLDDEPFARSCLSIYQEDGRRIAEVSREGFMRIEEAEANAHLIAAAPDMYEALKALTFQFAAAVERPYPADTRVYTQANEALAKAEGR